MSELEALRELAKAGNTAAIADGELITALTETLAKTRHELAATQQAKQENDERFMIERDAAREELYFLRQQIATGEASDGNHSFNELYDFRMLYHASAVNWWVNAGLPVVKSERHHDGELCFGGGWFIVVAQLPAGQVSNHYEMEYWDLFNVPQVECPPEFDSHTAADVLDRLRHAVRCWRNVGTD